MASQVDDAGTQSSTLGMLSLFSWVTDAEAATGSEVDYNERGGYQEGIVLVPGNARISQRRGLVNCGT